MHLKLKQKNMDDTKQYFYNFTWRDKRLYLRLLYDLQNEQISKVDHMPSHEVIEEIVQNSGDICIAVIVNIEDYFIVRSVDSNTVVDTIYEGNSDKIVTSHEVLISPQRALDQIKKIWG